MNKCPSRFSAIANFPDFGRWGPIARSQRKASQTPSKRVGPDEIKLLLACTPRPAVISLSSYHFEGCLFSQGVSACPPLSPSHLDILQPSLSFFYTDCLMHCSRAGRIDDCDKCSDVDQINPAAPDEGVAPPSCIAIKRGLVCSRRGGG